jgi:hypothetical protein
MKVHAHFKKLQEDHQALSEHHDGMASECEKEGLDTMAEKCRAVARVHSGLAAHYKAMHGEAATKAAQDDLEKSRNALEPSRVSGVVPDNPTLRAVPRFGAKALGKAAVDEEFADLVKIQDEE